MHGLSVLIGLWAQRNPPNAVAIEMADYAARRTFADLKVEEFARLIRPTALFCPPILSTNGGQTIKLFAHYQAKSINDYTKTDATRPTESPKIIGSSSG